MKSHILSLSPSETSQPIETTQPLETSPTQPSPVDLLILGAGWTSNFLLPLLLAHKIRYAKTTRTGHDNSVPFTYDPSSDDPTPFETLPSARCVLVTFPLNGADSARHLVTLYSETHPSLSTLSDHVGVEGTHWILLGSTGIYKAPGWNSAGSPYDTEAPRAKAEDGLLELLGKRACVLCLAGLWGGERQPRKWVKRVVKTKGEVGGKGGVHLVHGGDVGRGIVGCLGGMGVGTAGGGGEGSGVWGKRWIVTDLMVYDWWELFMLWGKYARERAGQEGEGWRYEQWVMELMREEGVRALPRDKERLGRLVDGRAFWEEVGMWPEQGRPT